MVMGPATISCHRQRIEARLHHGRGPVESRLADWQRQDAWSADPGGTLSPREVAMTASLPAAAPTAAGRVRAPTHRWHIRESVA